MYPNVIDPSLLSLRRRPGPAPWRVPHTIVPTITESISRLRRLPNQIGDVTTASWHSLSTAHEQLSFTSLSPNQGYHQNGNLQPLNLAFSHVSNVVTPNWFQVASLPQTPNAYYRQIPHEESEDKDSDLFTQTQDNSPLPHLQAEDTLQQVTRGKQQTTTEFPKFHCGEPGCAIFRTDGNNHGGKYSMSSHYKKKHLELKFDVTKLVSSANGQKSGRMSLEVGADRFTRKQDLSSVTKNSDGLAQDKAVRPAMLSVPAQEGSTRIQHQSPSTKAEPTIFANQPDILRDHDHPSNSNGIVHTNNQQLSSEPTMPKLPRVRPKSFTHVYDHYQPPEFFKTHIRAIRAKCDTEFFTVRRLLLTYTRHLNQPDTAFQSLRRAESTRCLQNIHKFVTTAIGPSDLDARAVGLGLQGDTVAEVALIITVALQRVHVPANGVWPDGTILPRQESQRRFWCCELQAMKLCLFTFRQMVRFWSGRVEEIAAGSAATILLEVTESGDNGDCQMVGG